MPQLEVRKRVKNAVLYTNGLIRIDNVRLSYPHVDKKHAQNEGDTPAFSATGLANKKTHKEAKDLLVMVRDEILKENKLQKIASDKFFVRDGDDKSDKEGYEGHWTISAREAKRPALRDGEGNRVEDPDDAAEIFYAGCVVSMVVRPWFQKNKHGTRVNAGLVSLRFMKDGDPLGNSRISDDEIDDIYGDDSGDDSGDDDDRSSRRSRRDIDDDDDTGGL